MSRLASLLLPVAACGGGDPEPPAFDFCPAQHADGAVVVCDEAFAAHPRVHLPADVLGGDGTPATIYVALDPIAPRSLVRRDGTRVALADGGGAIQPFAETGSDRLDDGFAWPSYEFLETIYEVTGTAAHVELDEGSGPVSVAAILDPVARPVVRLAPEVIDGVMTGAWEGSLSRRIGENEYDETQRVPIRVAWSGYEAAHQVIPHWEPGDGELSYALVATGAIANAAEAVTAADGGCIPALASLGDANPIADATAAVRMVRIPAMHAAGDYQLVWNGGMGSILPLHPAAAIQDGARDEFLVATSHPHGAPNGMTLEGFRAVAGGGSSCAPP